MARDKDAIRNKPDDPCILYWIKDASCTDIALHGYVGITHAAREQQRQREHRRAGRLNASAEFIVLHRGTRLECTEVENRYRPNPNIGWNRSKGGGRWRNKKTSAEPDVSRNEANS